MAIYTQILNGKAHWIFQSDETLEQLRGRFAPDCFFMDITGLDPQPQEQWDFDGAIFSAPVKYATLADAQKAKLEELSMAANVAYEQGFYSSAVGGPWWYDSSRDDQTLLEGLYQRAQEADWNTYVRYPGVCSAGFVPIRCRKGRTDPDTSKQISLHTGPQITQLGRDLEKHMFKVKTTLWQLQGEVQSASTVEAVEVISWPQGFE